MQILPIDPSFQRAILQGNAGPEGLNLTLGQRIVATILKVNSEGELLLDLGTQKLWARSALPFVEGQEIRLRVNQDGPIVQLQLLDIASESSVENYDLAAVLQAGDKTAAASLNPEKLLAALGELIKSDVRSLSAPQSEQLKALLEPLTVSADSRTLVPQLKNQLENSGIFFEAKLRNVLEALSSSPEGALQKLGSDLKVLVGYLRQNSAESVPAHPPAESQPRALGSQGSPVAVPAPEVEPARPSVQQPGQFSESINLPPRPIGLERSNLEAQTAAALGSLFKMLQSSPDKALQQVAANASSFLARMGQENPRSMVTQLPSPAEQKVDHAGEEQSSQPIKTPVPHTSRQPAASVGDPTGELKTKMSQLVETLRLSVASKEKGLLPELESLLNRIETSIHPTAPEATATPAQAMLLTQTAALSEQLLARQTEAAFEWLKNGAFQAELPLQFGTYATQAKIRFFQDPDKSPTRRSGLPLNANIFLDLPKTGRLEAWARWEGSQIQATLYVQDTAVRDLFEPQLKELSRSLREAGFSSTQLEVRIDPVRLYRMREATEEQPLSDGSLLSLRV